LLGKIGQTASFEQPRKYRSDEGVARAQRIDHLDGIPGQRAAPPAVVVVGASRPQSREAEPGTGVQNAPRALLEVRRPGDELPLFIRELGDIGELHPLPDQRSSGRLVTLPERKSEIGIVRNDRSRIASDARGLEGRRAGRLPGEADAAEMKA